MHSTNFDAKISGKNITSINRKLFQKIATHALHAIMGIPRTNYFNECISEVSRYGRKAKPSTKYCERSEQIELIKYSNLIKAGGLQND